MEASINTLHISEKEKSLAGALSPMLYSELINGTILSFARILQEIRRERSIAAVASSPVAVCHALSGASVIAACSS
jgi:hypothetical protein